MKISTLLLIFASGIISFAAIAGAAPEAMIKTPPWQPIGRYAHPDIRESSGIVASRQFEGVYWTLNDSGNPAALYATKRNGQLIQAIIVKGSRNFDWEALGIDAENRLWIGEIGNNSRLRFDLKVVVVAEPDPFTETEAVVIASYPYRYPNENVDAEGLFIVEGIPYIVSKEPERAVLYRFPALQPDTKQVLEKIGEFAGARLVTGAGVSEDGNRLAICTYDALWVYQRTSGDLAEMIQSTAWHLPHKFYGEAVCFDGYDLVLTNEARDLYALPQFWYEKTWELPPKDTRSAVELFAETTIDQAKVEIESYRAAGIDIAGNHVTLTPETPGQIGSLTVPIDVPYRDMYEVRAVLTRGPTYAKVQLSVDGTSIGAPYDCYADESIAGTLVSLGTAPLAAGENRVMLSLVGNTSDAADAKIGIDSYQVLHASPFVSRYAVLGPFPKTDTETLDELLRTEDRLDLKKTYIGVDGKSVTWQEITARANGFLDLRRDLTPLPMHVGYTLVYVYAPKPTDSAMLIGSDDAIAVWLNGTEIHRKRIEAGASPDADAVPCQLQAGWNRVLCQKTDEGWSWGLYLRFTDADQVLKYATQPSD